MGVEFENTSTRTQIILWYSVTGAEPMTYTRFGKPRPIAPMSARFTFKDGDPKDLFVNGKLLDKHGFATNRVERIKEIHIWSQGDWPSWLTELYKIAMADYAEAIR